MQIPQEIISKIGSGKFWLTIICGVVFAFTACKKIIPSDAVITILTMVFISYFQKKDNSTGVQK